MQRILPAMLALALVAMGCADDGNAPSPPESSPEDSLPSTTATATSVPTTTAPTTTVSTTTGAVFTPTRTPRPCEAAEEFDAECWWVTVPVHPDDPTGPTYELAVTRLPSSSDSPGDPVVYLSGGPGYPGGNPLVWGNSSLRDDRDVIVYDQRGTGLSTPDMQCPEMEEAIFAILGAAAPFADELAARNTAVEACHARLVAAGIDLDSFSTPHSSADLDLVRQALEIERWHLFGVSYGTRLALDAMRSYPDGIGRAILDSVYPTTVGEAGRLRSSAARVFAELIETCAATTCGADHADLSTQFDLAIERYDEAPHALTVPFDGVDRSFELTGPDVAAGLFNALYDTETIPVLPTVIEAFAAGDTALARTLVEQGVDFLNSAAEGMAMATECADNGNLASAADWEEQFADPDIYATLLLVAPASMCPWFPVQPVDPSFNEPVDTRVSAMILGGTLDPITPPEGVAEVTDQVFAPYPLVLPQYGHGIVFASSCAAEITAEWLRDPGNAKNFECDITEPAAWALLE